jgi:hypothetical protein
MPTTTRPAGVGRFKALIGRLSRNTARTVLPPRVMVRILERSNTDLLRQVAELSKQNRDLHKRLDRVPEEWLGPPEADDNQACRDSGVETSPRSRPSSRS